MTCNPIASIQLAKTEKTNGQLTFGIGVDFPRGAILACGGVSFSKAGISHILRDWGIGSALIARAVGLVDTLLTLLLLGPAIISYVVIILIALVGWIFLSWNIMLCSPSVKAFLYTIGIFAICSPLTIVVAVLLTCLSPLQIIVPEFTSYVLQVHKWGSPEAL